MKKLLLTLFIGIFIQGFIFSQNLDSNNYVFLQEDPSTIKLFKYVKHKSNFIEYFVEDKADFNNKQYYIRIRKYSWGKTDTAYFRKGSENFYSYEKENNEESIEFPFNPKLGDIWYESDKTWKYEIVGLDENFKTPNKTYKNCVKVKCKQVGKKSVKEKSKVYFLYYSPEIGFVGNVDRKNRTLTYLHKIKFNLKDGDIISGKN